MMRRSGTVGLIGGSAVALAALFLPWLSVSTTFSGYPARQEVAPVALLPQVLTSQAGAGSALLVALTLGVALCAAVTVRTQRPARLLPLLAFLALLGLFAVAFALVMLPFILAFNAPYYRAAPGVGVWAALVGYVSVLLGVLEAQRAGQPAT